MKTILRSLIVCLLITSCKKINTVPEIADTGACIQTTFLQTEINEGLESVFFVNGNEGFVSGSNGGIYHTRDAGKHWSLQQSPVSAPIYSLFFVDAQNGFAVGGENACGGTGCTPLGGFILKTTNGGKNWNKVYTPSAKIEISSVIFVNASIGFCAGNNMILKTIDGGKTWTEYSIENLGGKMMQVHFINPQKGYVVGLFNKIVKTEDGGAHWNMVSPQSGMSYYAISEAKGATYVSGQGNIIKSTNGGDSWTTLTGSPSDIFAIHFINENKGFAFGRGDYSGGDWGHSYGSIYCTSDGGISWSGTASLKEAGLIKAVSFPSNSIGYAISGNGVIKLTIN